MNFAEGLQAAHSQLLDKTPSSALREMRSLAFSEFNQLGWPTRKNEDWKYTSLASLRDAQIPARVESDKISATSAALDALTPESVAPYKMAGAQNIVLVDGCLNESLSEMSESPGLKIQSLTGEELGAFLKDLQNEVQQNLPQQTKLNLQPQQQSSAFPRLNQAFTPALTLIEIEKETSVSRPLHLIHVSTGQDQFMSCPRVWVRLHSRAKLEFVESYVGKPPVAASKATATSDMPAAGFCNSVTDIELFESAKLTHLRVHGESLNHFHIGSTRVQQKRQSECRSLVLSVGNHILRHDLNVALKEEDTFSAHNGVYLTRQKQHHDHHSWIVHEVGGGQSQQLYKGLLDDQSRGVFSGKIVIKEGAQKANSEQLNNNLLLSRGAEVDSKPELEIYADDVKATHGSTTGQLNPEEVWYLQTRGIARSKAIQMISQGFALDLVLQLENPILRDYAARVVTNALSELHLEE